MRQRVRLRKSHSVVAIVLLFGLSAITTAWAVLVPVTITFSGLSGNPNLSPFAAYSESGFTVSPASGRWVILTDYGNPAPSIIFTRLATDPTITDEVTITAGGSSFSFNSVDLYSSITPIPYTITGLMNSNPVFAVSDTVPNTFGKFATVLNPHSTDLINTLVITLSNPANPCCSNPVGLDNIVVTPVSAVPQSIPTLPNSGQIIMIVLLVLCALGSFRCSARS